MSKPKSTNVDKWKGDILPRLHFFGTTEVEELDDKEKATLSLTKTLNNAIDKANNRFLSQMQREEAAKAKKRDRAAAQDRGYQVGGGDDGFQFEPALSPSSSPPPVRGFNSFTRRMHVEDVMATESGDKILLLIEPKSGLYDAYEPHATERVPLPVGVRQRGTSKVIRDTMLKLLGTVTANSSGASILNNTHFSDARSLYSQRVGITVEVEGCKEVPEIPFSDFYSGAVTAFDERGLELPVKKYSKLIGRKYAANTPLIKKLLEEVEGDQCGAVQSIVAAAQSARLLEQTDEHKVRSKQERRSGHPKPRELTDAELVALFEKRLQTPSKQLLSHVAPPILLRASPTAPPRLRWLWYFAFIYTV